MQKLWALSIGFKRSIFLVIFLSLLGLMLIRPIQYLSFSRKLNAIPQKDREQIEWFFRFLSWDTHFVLFGSKPMGFCGFLEQEPPQEYRSLDHFEDFAYRFMLPILKLNKGWNLWKKYEHLFPSSRFLLIENHDKSRSTIIFMINKSEFLKTVEENINDFRRILGNHITPVILLEKCQRSKDLISDVLKNNDLLLGILLGFGKHNAQLFFRREQIMGRSKSESLSLNPKKLLPSSEFLSLEEELDHINRKLGNFCNSEASDFNQILLLMPSFFADASDPETQQLKIEYEKQYKDIVKRFQKREFLETVLWQYCH
ncbi:MAG: hypothetical protein JSS32_09600 [Verrucomicrobia bacterium]|nr:hypothetical protein [Verrucomicrobiota bacterium]